MTSFDALGAIHLPERFFVSTTRRLPRLKGMFRLTAPLRKIVAEHYRGRADRFVEIDWFDRNLRMVVDRSSEMGSKIYWHGYHHRDELAFLDRFLQPEMVVLDVGANQGEIALFCAKRVRQGHVFAFEPHSGIAAQMETNLRLNQFRHVHVERIAVGDRQDTIDLYFPQNGDKLNEGLYTTVPQKGTPPVERVEIRTLDSFAKERKLSRVDVVKIDVEGGEHAVLRGAAAVIERWRPVLIVEIDAGHFSLAGVDVQDVIEPLSALGYRFYVPGFRGSLHDVDPVSLAKRKKTSNLVCISP